MPYWYSRDKWKARSLLVLLALLLLGNTAFSVILNEQAGEFTSALAAQDASSGGHQCSRAIRLTSSRSGIKAIVARVQKNAQEGVSLACVNRYGANQ
jgi:ABC-type uncharacterized transport system fused permease/ATPase subunit